MGFHGAERRRFGRREVFKAATLVLDDNSRVEGFVIDISEAGARIRSTEIERVHGQFYLEIPDDDYIVRCRVVHRLNDSVGVEFVRAARRLSWIRQGKSAN